MQLNFKEWLAATIPSSRLFKPTPLDECRYKKGVFGPLEDVKTKIKEHIARSRLRPGASRKDEAVIVVEAMRHQLTDYDKCWRTVDKNYQQGKYEDICDYLLAWQDVIKATSQLIVKLIERHDLFESDWVEPLLAANEHWTSVKLDEKKLLPQCYDDDNYGRSFAMRGGPEPTPIKQPRKT